MQVVALTSAADYLAGTYQLTVTAEAQSLSGVIVQKSQSTAVQPPELQLLILQPVPNVTVADTVGESDGRLRQITLKLTDRCAVVMRTSTLCCVFCFQAKSLS